MHTPSSFRNLPHSLYAQLAQKRAELNRHRWPEAIFAGALMGLLLLCAARALPLFF